MELSVVIPTHRRPGFLAEAIASALSQGIADLEVIVVDDSPDREGRAVVQRLADPRVTYVTMDPPTGGNPSRVRNTGLSRTTGRYVHFLDDDDRVVPGAYRRMIGALEAHRDRGVVFGRIAPFGDDPAALAREQRVFTTSARRARRLGRLGSPFLYAAHQLFAAPTMFVNSACLARREVAAAVGGYDEALRVMEDVDFFTRAIRAYGAVFLDEPVLEYRTGAPSMMSAHHGKSTGEAFRHMYARYAREHGRVELRVAQVIAKTILNRL
jgi:glycosyltransferase involved in cell wall biosynthesis